MNASIPASNTNILSTDKLALSIGGKQLCRNLSINLTSGHSLGVLGRNGTGKTTLLHTLLGLRNADVGQINICGKNINDWSRKELATKTGILFQNSSDEMPASVLEMAVLGRHPHSNARLWEDQDDIRLARHALTSMELDDLQDRQISSLSGGERQRLSLAMLLTQTPQLYLLDEPSNHLDIGFQIKALNVLQQKLQTDKSALCLATHDINLAARYCEQILLFYGNGEFTYGPAEQILTESNLSNAYGCQLKKVQTGTFDAFIPV